MTPKTLSLLAIVFGCAIGMAVAFHAPSLSPFGLKGTNSMALRNAMGGRITTRTASSSLAPRMVFGLGAEETGTAAWSPAGMTAKEFFEASVGEWKCLRTSHNIAFGMVEEVNTDMDVENLPSDHPEVLEMCSQHKVDPKDIILGSRVTWEGYSDWDDKEINGTTVFGLIEDEPNKGRLLRSQGYAETIPAVSQWEMTPRGEFILVSQYEALAAEEMMVFKTKDLRVRFSSIKTQGGKGVTTASLSTEVRQK